MDSNVNSENLGDTTDNAGAAASECREPGAPFIARPVEVLDDPALSPAQKRAILKSWLSDRHVVPDAPRWRQLENGAFVDSEDIQRALYALDDAEESLRKEKSSAPVMQSQDKNAKRWHPGIFLRKRDDNDDDPPPSPAGMRMPLPDIIDPSPDPMPRLVFAA